MYILFKRSSINLIHDLILVHKINNFTLLCKSDQAQDCQSLITLFGKSIEVDIKFTDHLKEGDIDTVSLFLNKKDFVLNYAKYDNQKIFNLIDYYDDIIDLHKKGVKNFSIYSYELEISKVRLDYILHNFCGEHKNARCFVLGNGPSLSRIDLKKLDNEISLGSNRCYLAKDKWGFTPNYWAIVDRLQIEYYKSDYENNLDDSIIKFYPFEYLSFLNFKNSCPFNHIYDVPNFPNFSINPDKNFLGHTVTFNLMQIASLI